jgi:tRNA A-37 threonylcarbamoyl transferase component Bud32
VKHADPLVLRAKIQQIGGLMEGNKGYWVAQALILAFYVITLVIYNRAKTEYAGGKIGAAVNMIMVFVALLFVSDYVDYFLSSLLPIGEQGKFNIMVLLRLVALSVLCFGGLRFFVSKTMKGGLARPASLVEVESAARAGSKQVDSGMPRGDEGVADSAIPSSAQAVDSAADEIGVAQDVSETMPALGRYEIIEELGRGGMGIVYKGRDPKLGRLTAIKTVRFADDFNGDQVEKMRGLFFREAEVVAKLSHPNIVTIYDVGEDLDLYYIAMEYLEGEDLEKYTEKVKSLPVRESIDIVSQVCDALYYAHSHGVVHRDIKPGNIMVLENGRVKVTDFGIARATESSKTRTGEIKGTPPYMSPEQLSTSKVDGRSDIFSVGVVLYWLFTGVLPFRADTLTTLMYQIAMVPHEPPSKHNPKIYKAAEAIVNRALEKKAERRYQTAKQMADHLRLLGRKIDESRARAKS